PFQRREEENAAGPGIDAIPFDDLLHDGAKESAVVVGIHQGLPIGKHGVDFSGLMFEIENSRVKVTLGGEMTEDDRLRDSCGVGNLFGRRALIPLLGEEVEGGFEKLLATIGGGETLVAGSFGWGCRHGEFRL